MGRRLVDAGSIVALLSFAVPWPDEGVHVLLPIGFLVTVGPALCAGPSNRSVVRLCASLATIALLIGLLAYAVGVESTSDPEGRGPFYLLIGLAITIAGIAWPRGTPEALRSMFDVEESF